MFDVTLWIVTPLSGALIGYFTNWLAIKMLFRPLTEKRIFGFKVPFTPGLIPKERFKLSKKVSEVIGTHLLTEEALSNSLNSQATVDSIYSILNSAFSKLETEERTIEDMLCALSPTLDTSILGSKFEDYLVNSLCDFLENNKSAIIDFISDKGLELLNRSELSLYISDFLFSDTSQLYVKQALAKNLPTVLEKLAEQIETNDYLDEKLRASAIKLIDEQAGRLMGLFINSNKIYENVKQGALDYISNTENHDEIYRKLCDFLEVATTNKDNFTSLKNIDIYSFIIDIEPSFEEKLKTAMIATFDSILKNEVRDFLYSVIRYVEQKVLSVHIGDFTCTFISPHRQSILDFIQMSIKPLIAKSSVYIANALNIRQITEDKINEFEVEMGERIIISVVNRELQAITVVGGVLGLVIGLLPAFLKILGL